MAKNKPDTKTVQSDTPAPEPVKNETAQTDPAKTEAVKTDRKKAPAPTEFVFRAAKGNRYIVRDREITGGEFRTADPEVAAQVRALSANCTGLVEVTNATA